jgi:hypothetical protein
MLEHVPLDRIPAVKDFASSKRTKVVDAFVKDRVVQPIADGPYIVMNALGQLLGGKILSVHHHPPMLIDPLKRRFNSTLEGYYGALLLIVNPFCLFF